MMECKQNTSVTEKRVMVAYVSAAIQKDSPFPPF